MTAALPHSPALPSAAAALLHFQVAMPQPANHLFEVTLQIHSWQRSHLDLKLPVWTPGSYLVREYARHLQGFTATASTGQSLSWQKLSKNHWQVSTEGVETIVLRYQIFANDLSVRTNHLDGSHGYFNPAALCFYVPSLTEQPIAITIVPPGVDWQVTTPLPALVGEPNTFWAADFDTLVDSPFEIGQQAIYEFDVLDKPHQWAIWGEGNFVPADLIRDTTRIIETGSALFGGLPYDRYIFLLHLSNQNNGGLEHKNCCSLNYSRFGFRNPEKYHRFLNLVAHEFFHLWNVKRIRPKALENFDYDAENYTPSLWFSEGTTSYYDQLIPLRAGLYDLQWYLKLLSETITRLQTTPGRLVQPLSESSFDAWIKLYRADAHSRNSQISYYLKGELVSLLLDLRIRQRQNQQKSLDDVMRQVWQQFGQTETGFTPAELKAVLEAVAGEDLTHFYELYIDGTVELPFNDYLHPFGLELVTTVAPEDPPYLGLTAKTENNATVVKTVDRDSPAGQAGIDPGDELLAIDGFRVGAEQLNERLKDYRPGEQLTLTLFHGEQLQTRSLQLAPAIPSRYQVRLLENLSAAQTFALQQWLGVE
uniref:Peptidase M61 domain protein n=1 Tax=Cyanothece sp. (strain PCC 7425 / ATCC 29141) TaxID=395961 RepID=B8HNS5_CYAP4